jgi:CelD/BcsL family acetyltransferase involved in cellulose biosynthesis
VYASPFFCPQFTLASAADREDIFVAVLEQGNRTEGFFPFQANASGGAEPAARRMSDYEGVIVRSGAVWTAQALLRGCALVRWDFRFLIASQTEFHPYHEAQWTSPVIDTGRGLPSRISQKLKKQFRALGRDRGPVRFVAHVADPEALNALLRCKGAQYSRTGLRDGFPEPWAATVFRRIHATQDADFAGTLSVLYAGDRAIAHALGMQSRNVWHYWINCFDRDYAKYSPGLLLLAEMAGNARSAGLAYIDLGPGDEPYKLRLMNSGIPIARGAVVLSGD